MTNAHDFHFTRLADATDLPLSDHAGKPVLLVNVASACGLTPQYGDLQRLYEDRRAEGLVVLGVPCNDFGQQESGTESEIAEFCDLKYRVAFPMTGKIEILSPKTRHPFYAWVAAQLGEEALPRWNFHKYLIGKDGALLESFGSRTPPLAAEVTGAIDNALR
jgi:glutathione peroxidase